MRRARQSGVAAITAVLIVAVAASAVALMLAQQSATLDQAMMVASRAQADEYAQAGLDWARGVIAADDPGVDSLADGWAQPMVGLPVDRAIVSGEITDEQGKFNLNNLVVGDKVSPDDVAIFRRLLASLGLPPELSDAVVDWIDSNDTPTGAAGAEDAWYLALPQPYRTADQPMVQVEELYRVRGFDPATVAKLRPYVTALVVPGVRTTINANTASAVVLEAVLPDVPPAAIDRMVAQRVANPFRSGEQLSRWALGVDAKADTSALGVASSFFSVQVRVTQDDIQLATDALIQRGAAAGQTSGATLLWRRPRY
ncbi:MAG TPA: type II secretion system minor pseudopilin GspK [Usitatibacter sp.]|nr:type II secretion system minor pseudopilin GspK [Usitatibacter sp.]